MRDGGALMQAGDIMTTNVVTAAPDDRVDEVAKTLLARNIAAVPVIDDRGGRSESTARRIFCVAARR